MDNSFQNSFPVEKKTAGQPDIISPPRRTKKNMSVINAGQILLLVILSLIIILQAINLISAPAQHINAEPDIINQQAAPEDLNYAGEAAQSAPDEPIIFILGENNGRLAVLSPDGQTVYETFSVYINTLPEYDRNMLLEGIKIRTAEELSSLLEDFSS